MALRDATYWANRVYQAIGAAIPSPDAQTTAILTALDAQIPDLYLDAVAQVGTPIVNYVGVRLAYLYCLRDALSELQAALWPKVDARLERELNVSESQKFRNVKDLMARVEKEIPTWETRVRGIRPPLVAAILQTSPTVKGLITPAPDPSAPLAPRPGSLPCDPNDPRWSGSPLAPDCDFFPYG